MLGTGTFFVLSSVLLAFFLWFFASEEKREVRYFLGSLRNLLDKKIETITNFILKNLLYLGRHMIKLSWYYSIHKMLRLILTLLVKMYDSLELYFIRNKERARTIKLEKKSFIASESHLGQVAEHKASTTLTAGQKKKLLQKKLERG